MTESYYGYKVNFVGVEQFLFVPRDETAPRHSWDEPVEEFIGVNVPNI